MPALKKPSGNGARSVPRRCLPSSEVSRQALPSAPSVTTASFWCPANCRASTLMASRPLPNSGDRPRPSTQPKRQRVAKAVDCVVTFGSIGWPPGRSLSTMIFWTI